MIELQAQLDAKNVSLEVSPQARTWLAEQGYDKAMGARPMGRLIQEKVKKELANELLFGSLSAGGSVTIGLKDNELQFTYTSAEVIDPVLTVEK